MELRMFIKPKVLAVAASVPRLAYALTGAARAALAELRKLLTAPESADVE